MFKKIKEAMGFLNTNDVRELLNEGLEARQNSNFSKVKEILEKNRSKCRFKHHYLKKK